VRFTSFRAACIGLIAAGAVGCASGGGSGSSSDVADQAASGKLGPAFLQWSGRFRSQVTHDAHLAPNPVRHEASGSVRIDAPSPGQTHVSLDLSLPEQTDPVRLYWAVVQGSCGSNALPLLTVSQFPQIPINSSRGTLDANLAVPMPTAGTWHVNVFGPNTAGSDESDVISCADLTLEKKR
jgi:hypothetical protein